MGLAPFSVTARRLLQAVSLALTLALGIAGNAAGQSDDFADANQLFRQGQYDRAMDKVNAYLGSRPKDARGRFLKGLIFTEQNKPADAIKTFTELTQDYPELPEPYNNLAVLYASQGQYDKARGALEMAIRTHPSYATAHENLGDIYARMASQAYDKALQLDRANQTAQTKLNLIKDLFTTNPRGGKPVATSATKVEAAPKAAPTPAPAATPPAPQSAPAKAPETAATAKPAPAAKPPEPVVAAKEPPRAAPATDDVLKAVDRWAKSWSSNDVTGYLSHYAPDFKTPPGESRSVWESQRKARIAKPKKIQVSVESPKVTFDERNKAKVTFRQNYRSDTMKASSVKTLIMVKSGDRWLIQQERVGS
jgi:tetratricopeptide (TPR) repeat protein